MRFARQSANSLKILSQPIPDGDAGVTRTVQIMKALTYGRGGVRSPEVRYAALLAVRETERGMAEIDAVLDWIKRNIEFRGEHGETLQEPRITLRFRAGDCDDQSTLAAAMLSSLGFPVRFRTVAMKDDQGEFSHVYLEVFHRESKQWLSVDPTVAHSWPGWEPQEIARSARYGTMLPRDTSLSEGLITAAATLGALYLASQL